MNSAMHILHFSRNAMWMVLFLAQPTGFHCLEVNLPSQWDDSSQGQANRPSGRANCPSFLPPSLFARFFTSSHDVSIFLYFKVPFWVKSNCSVSKPSMFPFYSLIHSHLCSVFWFIFGIWYYFKYVFGIFVWCCSIPLSMWLIWLYLLVRYILLP